MKKKRISRLVMIVITIMLVVCAKSVDQLSAAENLIKETESTETTSEDSTESQATASSSGNAAAEEDETEEDEIQEEKAVKPAFNPVPKGRLELPVQRDARVTKAFSERVTLARNDGWIETDRFTFSKIENLPGKPKDHYLTYQFGTRYNNQRTVQEMLDENTGFGDRTFRQNLVTPNVYYWYKDSRGVQLASGLKEVTRNRPLTNVLTPGTGISYHSANNPNALQDEIQSNAPAVSPNTQVSDIQLFTKKLANGLVMQKLIYIGDYQSFPDDLQFDRYRPKTIIDMTLKGNPGGTVDHTFEVINADTQTYPNFIVANTQQMEMSSTSQPDKQATAGDRWKMGDTTPLYFIGSKDGLYLDFEETSGVDVNQLYRQFKMYYRFPKKFIGNDAVEVGSWTAGIHNNFRHQRGSGNIPANDVTAGSRAANQYLIGPIDNETRTSYLVSTRPNEFHVHARKAGTFSKWSNLSASGDEAKPGFKDTMASAERLTTASTDYTALYMKTSPRNFAPGNVIRFDYQVALEEYPLAPSIWVHDSPKTIPNEATDKVEIKGEFLDIQAKTFTKLEYSIEGSGTFTEIPAYRNTSNVGIEGTKIPFEFTEIKPTDLVVGENKIRVRVTTDGKGDNTATAIMTIHKEKPVVVPNDPPEINISNPVTNTEYEPDHSTDIVIKGQWKDDSPLVDLAGKIGSKNIYTNNDVTNSTPKVWTNYQYQFKASELVFGPNKVESTISDKAAPPLSASDNITLHKKGTYNVVFLKEDKTPMPTGIVQNYKKTGKKDGNFNLVVEKTLPGYELVEVINQGSSLGSATSHNIKLENEVQTIQVIYREIAKKKVKVTVEFVDTALNALKSSGPAGGTIPNEEQTLTEGETFRLKYADGGKYDFIGYTFDSFQPAGIGNEYTVTVPDKDFVVKMIYTGSLSMHSATTDLDYGSHQLSVFGNKDIYATTDLDITIFDTRESKRKFDLQVTLKEDFVSTDAAKRPFNGFLKFKDTSTAAAKTVTKTAQSITENKVTPTTGQHKSTWKQGDKAGLYVEEHPGNLIGNYSATVLWNVVDGK